MDKVLLSEDFPREIFGIPKISPGKSSEVWNFTISMLFDIVFGILCNAIYPIVPLDQLGYLVKLVLHSQK